VSSEERIKTRFGGTTAKESLGERAGSASSSNISDLPIANGNLTLAGRPGIIP
jgi:hypothetical protein